MTTLKTWTTLLLLAVFLIGSATGCVYAQKNNFTNGTIEDDVDSEDGIVIQDDDDLKDGMLILISREELLEMNTLESNFTILGNENRLLIAKTSIQSNIISIQEDRIKRYRNRSVLDSIEGGLVIIGIVKLIEEIVKASRR